MATPSICSVPDCRNPAKVTGLCTAHYLRLRRHGSVDGGGTMYGAPQRWLDEHIPSKTDDCLIWPFARDNFGYAKMRNEDENDLVHRIVCKQKHGAAPVDKPLAVHECGNGDEACVNDRHIRWGTYIENQEHRIGHGTSNRGKGGILTEAQARSIKGRLAAGERCADLAREFGVNFVTVHDIQQRRSWAWL